MLSLLPRTLLAAALFFALGVALAASPADACGNPGERACCALEASFGACVDGAIEVPGCTAMLPCDGCRGGAQRRSNG